MKMNLPVHLGLIAAAIVAGAAVPVLILATHGGNARAAAPMQSQAPAAITCALAAAPLSNGIAW